MDLEETMVTSTENRFRIVAGNCFGIDGIFLKQGSGRLYAAEVEVYRIPVNLINVFS